MYWYLIVGVQVQGDAEEEDPPDVAVAVDSGDKFMDEFFEQVCFSHCRFTFIHLFETAFSSDLHCYNPYTYICF